MIDPFAVLEVKKTDDDATIRRAYLQKIKIFTPEKAPEEFSRIREAYEMIRSSEQRVTYRIHSLGWSDPESRDGEIKTPSDSVASILEEIVQRMPRPRPTLSQLFQGEEKP